MHEPAKLKVSIRLFALNVLGAVLAAAGVYYLALGNWLGAALLVTGGALVTVFMVDLFKRIGALQRALRQQDGNQG
ncbi:hypothetical protein [Chitinimonas sp.]|uniref:hypothetical protein n=1 Tax=Chitinimonas sp. TaxID=1934313 RepID=UPI0035B40A90